MPIQIACADCGTTCVTWDAWAECDVATQAWVLGAVYDDGFCHRCGVPSSLVETPVQGDGAITSGRGASTAASRTSSMT